jgi:hypothetical protein
MFKLPISSGVTYFLINPNLAAISLLHQCELFISSLFSCGYFFSLLSKGTSQGSICSRPCFPYFHWQNRRAGSRNYSISPAAAVSGVATHLYPLSADENNLMISTNSAKIAG